MYLDEEKRIYVNHNYNMFSTAQHSQYQTFTHHPYHYQPQQYQSQQPSRHYTAERSILSPPRFGPLPSPLQSLPPPVYELPPQHFRTFDYLNRNYNTTATGRTSPVTAAILIDQFNFYPPPEKLPIRMQREEIIIEQRQLMNGSQRTTAMAADGVDVESGQHLGEGILGNKYNRHHYTQIIAALAVSLGPLAAGLGKGYTSPAIANLQDLQIRHKGENYTTFSVTDQQASWVASLSLLGALFGGMFGGVAMQYGRKRVLTVMSLPFSLAWLLTVFAKSVETMFATAFIAGFCCSIVSMVTQVYISEISSPDIRGFLSAIQKISGHLGVLISFSLGAYLDWRQLAMLVGVAPMMLFVTVIYVPETPSFLVLMGRDEDAYRSLQWLRGPRKNVELELETIRANIRASKQNAAALSNLRNAENSATANCSGGGGVTSSLNNNEATATAASIFDFTSGGFRTDCISRTSARNIFANVKQVLRNVRLIKPLMITCGLMVFQRFTGANSFGFYAVKIFRQTFAGMNPHGGAIAVGIVQLLASMLSGLLIDTVGRIPLLITSSVFMSLALASFGSYVYYEEANKLNAIDNFEPETLTGSNDWIPLLCVLAFTIAFSLGISPISSLLVGELYPLEYRGLGSSISTSFSYLCSFLAVKTFVDFQELLGLHGAFWLYACISCLGLLFVVMFVPETKGKDLDEMDPNAVRTLTINR